MSLSAAQLSILLEGIGWRRRHARSIGRCWLGRRFHSVFTARDRHIESLKLQIAKIKRSIKGIARELGVSRNMVPKYLQHKGPPAYGPRLPRPTKLDRYKDYLTARVEAAIPDWIPATVLL